MKDMEIEKDEAQDYQITFTDKEEKLGDNDSRQEAGENGVEDDED